MTQLEKTKLDTDGVDQRSEKGPALGGAFLVYHLINGA